MALALAACVLTSATPQHLDRRVVDAVDVGNARSEAEHGYEGQDATAGMVNGQSYRQARGWMHFTLTTFDDTDVTKGKTNIVVIIRARGGLTPALRELRTIQDHHEVELSLNPSGVFR